MKRAQLEKSNDYPTFIGAWQLKNEEICDQIIEFFNSGEKIKKAGETAAGLQPNLKQCTDCSVEPTELQLPGFEPFKDYMQELLECYEDYKLEWPFLAKFAHKVDIGKFNIQKYDIGDHYKAVHTERMSLTYSHRLFAWMTYLNDVHSGGETVFTHYGIRVRPKKGLTLIWPVEWTHAHFGDELLAGEKYIINGHMQFPIP